MSKVKNIPPLGLKLKRARRDLGMSQREMSEALQISDKAISSYEVGRAVPSLDTLRDISRVTHKPLMYFIDDAGSNQYEVRQKLNTIERELAAIRKLLENTPPSKQDGEY
jgi:transcriptional regulator with XRE-family HTH domain